MNTLQKIDELLSDLEAGEKFKSCPPWVTETVLENLKTLKQEAELTGFSDNVNGYVRGACKFITESGSDDCEELAKSVFSLHIDK